VIGNCAIPAKIKKPDGKVAYDVEIVGLMDGKLGCVVTVKGRKDHSM
jgi:hypothetical protein